MVTGTASKATNGKQNTPLADNEKKTGLPTVDLAALAGKIDWSKLPEPKRVAKGEPVQKVNEDQIPEAIRNMVEECFKSNEYFEVPIEDETVRAAYVQFVRTYCYVRKAGRLSSRVTIMEDGKTVRYSVGEFKERPKK